MVTRPTALVLPGVSPRLQGLLDDGVAAVEAMLHARVDHDDEFIAEANGHLLNAGGKRVRPLLTLLAAELGSGVNESVIKAAAGVELTHLASLYHDDVMDEAAVRRGAPSANAKYDNSTAILVGDLLFGTASDLIADLGPEAVKIQSQTFMRLCSGQIRDDRPCPPAQEPRSYYLGVLADKTGVLIATAARYGAMLSGCPPETVAVLAEFGERVGVAFQLADDLIDVSSEAEAMGKVPGTDIREGKRTLPMIYALASTDPRDARLQALLRHRAHTDEELAEALALLRPHVAMDRARAETELVLLGLVVVVVSVVAMTRRIAPAWVLAGLGALLVVFACYEVIQAIATILSQSAAHTA